MKIALSRIKSSPNPIRKTWDEEKLEELKWSFMEEGQVEPIGVRMNGEGYIIVWGHRRAEAARRANWDEIDCVIVAKDELNNLIQAGIENLSGEEMNTDDKADWANRLIEMGLSINEISRRTGVASQTIGKWLIYRREKEQGTPMGVPGRAGDTDYRKIVEIHSSLGNDIASKKIIAEKVNKDELNTLQTRAVADAYRDAPSPQVKAAVLRVDVEKHDTAADIIKKADVIYSTERKIPSLMQAPLVVQGFRDWQEIGVSISYLKHVNQDVPTAIMILKQWIGYAETRLAEMKAITEPSDD